MLGKGKVLKTTKGRRCGRGWPCTFSQNLPLLLAGCQPSPGPLCESVLFYRLGNWGFKEGKGLRTFLFLSSDFLCFLVEYCFVLITFKSLLSLWFQLRLQKNINAESFVCTRYLLTWIFPENGKVYLHHIFIETMLLLIKGFKPKGYP